MEIIELDNGIIKRINTFFDNEESYTLGRKRKNKLIYREYYPSGKTSIGGCEIVKVEKADYFIAIKGIGCFPVRKLGKYSCLASIESCFRSVNMIPIHSQYASVKEGFDTWSKRWNKRI